MPEDDGHRSFDESVSMEFLEQAESVCTQFENAWQQGKRPDLAAYLGEWKGKERAWLLWHLLQLELELLDKRGILPEVSEYAARFPGDVTLIEKAFHDYFPSQVLLEVIIGPHKGRKFSFARHDNFLVGRARYAHFRLPLKDPFFSRAHFMVEVNPPNCQLVDLCSLNGTKVNGQLVDSAVLSHGDLVQGGDTVMMVSLAGFDTECVEKSATVDQPVELEQGLDNDDIPSSIAGYQVVRPLGRGGMGVVYQVRRVSDGAELALKTIRPAVAVDDRELQRFLREAQILCALKHPNIVTFHQMGRDGELFYIVMDYVRGMDARELLKQSGPLPISRAVQLICQVLDALEYAHKQGFVHRDVKPANMLLSSDAGNEICRLADFGLARVYYESRMSGITTLGNVGGTIPYMAPEQITNYRDAQPSADQYAAAATLCHLLTGHFVHDVAADRHNQRLMKILLEEPVPIGERRADIPHRLAATIHRALAKKPAERFSGAAEFRQELLSCLV